MLICLLYASGADLRRRRGGGLLEPVSRRLRRAHHHPHAALRAHRPERAHHPHLPLHGGAPDARGVHREHHGVPSMDPGLAARFSKSRV